ncbi:MAG: hypothetical protein EBQ59_00130, partial [Verrucomicrobia bacterium]|nr:hypothetical protein [Verrucomicrobiota bacterium]
RRCAQPVVELVNSLLGDLEPHGPFFSTEAAEQWAKVWADHESKNKDKPELGEALWVRLKNLEEPAEDKEGDDDQEEETSKVACQAKWIGAHIEKSGLTERGLLKPGITCAILVSKNSQAAEITEQLRRMGIEAADEASAEIAMDNPFTAGIVALIKNTAHPTDRLSKGMANMSPSAKAFVDACGSWEQARLRIAEVFYEKGGEALLQELLKGKIPTGADNAERFLAKRVQQILALAVKFDEDDHRDLGQFATHLEKSSLRDTADPRSVQVLTIHRSKGLQYTAVYLPCLNSDKQKVAEVRVKDPMVKTDANFIPEWVVTRPKTEVCEADPATLEAVLTKERTAAAYENLCRIYVGMTRAIRRLVLVTDEIELESREELTDDKKLRKYDFATLIEAALGGTTGTGLEGKPLELKGACPAEIMVSHGSNAWIAHAVKAQPAAAEAAVRDVSTLTPVRELSASVRRSLVRRLKAAGGLARIPHAVRSSEPSCTSSLITWSGMWSPSWRDWRTRPGPWRPRSTTTKPSRPSRPASSRRPWPSSCSVSRREPSSGTNAKPRSCMRVRPSVPSSTACT